MRFERDFRFMFAKRICGFVIAMAAAWTLRSYWALVIGAIAGRVIGVLLSYSMHPMRPRVSVSRFREIFSVSQWMLVRSIGTYLNETLHRILVGNRNGTATMGSYTLAVELSAMPATELLSPINRVLFPAFVNAKHDLEELKRLYLLALGVQTIVAMPAGVGLSIVAYEAVLVLLGEQWLQAIPFVQLLAIANVVQAMTTSGAYIVMTVGQVRKTALIVWVQVVTFAIVAVLLMPGADALAIAWIRLGTVLGASILLILALTSSLQTIRLVEMVTVIARPIAACVVMALVIWAIGSTRQFHPLASLLLKVVVGAATYALTVLILWQFAGRPHGAEAYLLEKGKALRARISNSDVH
jgi:lipopolysaccharide exporter